MTQKKRSKKPVRRITKRPARKAAATSRPPRIGSYWRGQGGVYAGLMRGTGKQDYHLILATDDASKLQDVELGLYGTEVKGASDAFDGAANTAALAKAGSPLAQKLAALKVDGHKDFYLPSRFESALLYANLRDLLETGYWHWTSTQSSAINAWYQDFDGGYQRWSSKSSKGRARAVRRVFTHSVI